MVEETLGFFELLRKNPLVCCSSEPGYSITRGPASEPAAGCIAVHRCSFAGRSALLSAAWPGCSVLSAIIFW